MTTSDTAAPPQAGDRRAALKERHRQAIVDAADGLIREGRAGRFSVDELAERADVSRRTVFNHFASLDDVIVTACVRELAVVIDAFEARVVVPPRGDGSLGSLFEEIASTVRVTDLAPAISYLAQALDGLEDGETFAHRIMRETFARVSDQFVAAVTSGSPSAEPFDVELLVSTVLNGIAFIARRWADEAGGRLDDVSRARWDELLDRLLDTLRSGYPAP